MLFVGMLAAIVMVLPAQGEQLASPREIAAIEVGGKYAQGQEGPVYTGGKWIEVDYGRPPGRLRLHA